MVLAFFVIFGFSGCGTVKLQTTTKMTRTIHLFPVEQEHKTLFLEVKNTAASKIDLEPKLIEAFAKKEVKLVESVDQANYIMQVNVLFADNLREANALKAAAAIGAPVAIGTYAGTRSGTDSVLAGVAFALAAGTVAKVLEDETYRAVIDITVRERSNSELAVDGYLVHQTRVLSEAVKTGLKLEEAVPVMEDQAVEQISRII